MMLEMLKRSKLMGATIIRFDCRGCMASDHRFEWIGYVEGFEKSKHAGTVARVKIVKRDGMPTDYRDEDLGYRLEAIHNGGLQELAPKLWMVT
jgi:hypothetical protein